MTHWTLRRPVTTLTASAAIIGIIVGYQCNGYTGAAVLCCGALLHGLALAYVDDVTLLT